MISNLPEDIQNHIFYDYVKPDMIIFELEQILDSEESKKLNHQQLYYYLKNVILNNEIVIRYLLNNNDVFKIIYESHIVKKEIKFELFEDKINSMALSWLMYLYH